MALNFTLIYGSVRSGRQGIKAARFFENKLQQRGHQTSLIDPLEYPLPLLDKMYKEYKPEEAPEVLQKLAAMQLRMTLGELGMSSIPSLFPIPAVQDAFEEDGTPTNSKTDKYVARFLDEFEWYARALKNEKANGVPY